MKEILLKFGNKLPRRLVALYNALQDQYIMEYEFIVESQKNVRAITRSDKFDEDFHLFFRDPFGSLIGFWRIDENEFDTYPIVYFGRDGQFGVLASNFDDFLSLLYFASAENWQLCKYIDYLEDVEMSKKFGNEVRKIESARVSQEEIENVIERVKEEYGEQYSKTVDWLQQNNIPKPKQVDLFSIIEHTYENSPNLQAFIDGENS